MSLCTRPAKSRAMCVVERLPPVPLPAAPASQLLTWQLPWEGRNAFQLVFSVSKGERLPVPALEQVPGPQPSEQLFDAYVALLQRCWAQLPEERPAFNDVITDLR